MTKKNALSNPVWLNETDCNLDDFRSQIENVTSPEAVPLAEDILKNIPVYDGVDVRMSFADRSRAKAYMTEWNNVLATGPGILVVRNTYDDLALIDGITAVFKEIIEEEREKKIGTGDHFAAAGANSRIWNAHEKLCVAAPELFARYNANPVLPMVSQAWLGPLYQITMQVNVVSPGGKAQVCHRDYHMGFQPSDELLQYPSRVHALSAMLTLQGGIAHCDIPVESGITKLLPYSQCYVEGYLAVNKPEFQKYFEENCIQLPLKKGDAIYFNPAVFHAAGENKTKNIERIVNLTQIGSGYGRSIEILDRTRMSKVLYPTLKKMVKDGNLDEQQVKNVVAACAEGYPFPSNLDLDSPLSGMAPESQQGLMRRALECDWSSTEFEKALLDQEYRKRSC